jgi:hypothetical protein
MRRNWFAPGQTTENDGNNGVVSIRVEALRVSITIVAPVIDSSSWCQQHSRGVFNAGRKALPGFPGGSAGV